MAGIAYGSLEAPTSRERVTHLAVPRPQNMGHYWRWHIQRSVGRPPGTTIFGRCSTATPAQHRSKMQSVIRCRVFDCADLLDQLVFSLSCSVGPRFLLVASTSSCRSNAFCLDTMGF